MTHREISRLVKFYCENIRAHDRPQMVGVFRIIEKLLESVTEEQIDTALRNYAAYKCDVRYRKHIRSFFQKETILQWQTPHPSVAPAVPVADQVAYPVRARVVEDDEPNPSEVSF
jgi:hypothetical protein